MPDEPPEIIAMAPIADEPKPVYVCPQCGPDPRGADVHAEAQHTAAGLGLVPRRRTVEPPRPGDEKHVQFVRPEHACVECGYGNWPCPAAQRIEAVMAARRERLATRLASAARSGQLDVLL